MSDACMNHIENHWKVLTNFANEVFDKGNFEKALSAYENALYRAEVLNNNIRDCIRLKIPFIQVYIVSCNNLANTYEKLGKYKEAEKILKRVIYYLLYLVKNKDVDKDEIQSELKKSILFLNNFANKNKEKVFFKNTEIINTIKQFNVKNRHISDINS